MGEMRRILNGFLMNIEKLNSESIVISAPNYGEKLDKALYRRFDDLIEFSLPNDEEIWKTFLQLLKGFQTSKLSQNKIVQAARGLSYAEITRACEEAIKDMIIHDKKKINSTMLLNAVTERRLFSNH